MKNSLQWRHLHDEGKLMAGGHNTTPTPCRSQALSSSISRTKTKDGRRSLPFIYPKVPVQTGRIRPISDRSLQRCGLHQRRRRQSRRKPTLTHGAHPFICAGLAWLCLSNRPCSGPACRGRGTPANSRSWVCVRMISKKVAMKTPGKSRFGKLVELSCLGEFS